MKKQKSVVVVLTLIAILVFALTLTGCGGGNSGGERTSGTFLSTDEAEKQILNFFTALESYDLDGMLASLDKKEFELEFVTKDTTKVKNYDTLKNELTADMIKQLSWRKDKNYTISFGITDKNLSITGTGSSNSLHSIDFVVLFDITEKADTGTELTKNCLMKINAVNYPNQTQWYFSKISISGYNNTQGFGLNKMDLGN